MAGEIYCTLTNNVEDKLFYYILQSFCESDIDEHLANFVKYFTIDQFIANL